RLAHRPAERHAFLELQSDRFADQLRVELRLVHFLNIDEHLALGLARQILLELLDLRALAPDNDAGPRRVDGDAQLVARPVHFDAFKRWRRESLSSRSSRRSLA